MMSLMCLAACKPSAEKVPAIDLTDLDTSVAPGENFYSYANGGWQQKNPLKAEFARYGSFDALAEMNQERLNELFSSMTTMKTEAGSVESKIVTLYTQALDSLKRNADGAAPLEAYLDKISKAQSKSDLVNILAYLNKFGEGGFFNFGVASDLEDSNTQVLYLSQGGLGMGNRDYYIDPANAELKKGYEAMLVKLFVLCNYDSPELAARDAMEIEDLIAKDSWSNVQNRDVKACYNPKSSEQIISEYPGFDFDAFFRAMEVPAQDKIIVEQPSYFAAFSEIFEKQSVEKIRNYLVAQLITSASSYLSDDFYNANFDFYSKQMRGISEQRPRWKRAMEVPNYVLGEAVGKMYVAKYFPASSKQKVLEIVENLRTALGQRVDSLTWMGDSTKAYAHAKLAAFTVKIGYPDKWKDYSTLEVNPANSYFENICASSAWHVADNFSKLGKPTDRTEWHMSPQTVNAYYNPTTNEICFPAAILQPPFFNADADDAVNYGAIGVVIGHEMTHGFDDQGRLFDKDGNMAQWWTAADEAAFNEKAQVLVKQYDEVEVLPGVFADGALSLGENIADQGGVGISLTAFHNSLGGKTPAPIDGFTADQRFFLGYAHVWAANITDEEIARRTKIDVHSLGVNRVNMTLRNFPAFFEAFGIKEGDPMWRPESERVMIW